MYRGEGQGIHTGQWCGSGLFPRSSKNATGSATLVSFTNSGSVADPDPVFFSAVTRIRIQFIQERISGSGSRSGSCKSGTGSATLLDGENTLTLLIVLRIRIRSYRVSRIRIRFLQVYICNTAPGTYFCNNYLSFFLF